MKTIDVLIVGGGPAALSAAARVLERGGGRVRVKLVHMARTLGGKAVSRRRDDGSIEEHGWHMVPGFYSNMRGLMARAGVDPSKALTTMHHQSHCYERFDGRIHTMNADGGRLAVAARFAAYEGLPFEDRMNFSRFMAQAYSVALSGENLTKHDDICFDTWAVERGLRRHVTRYGLFRFFRIAYFNFPEQISAYHALQTLRLVNDSDTGELFVARGACSDTIWEPIGRYIERLGAQIESETVATDWIYEGDRVVAVRAARRAHLHEHTSGDTPTSLPAAPGTEHDLRGFDYVLSTVPVTVLPLMNAGDARMWSSPYFRRLLNFRGVSTLNLTVVTKKPIATQFRGPVHGFPAPLSFAVNMKPYWTEYATNPDVGSVLCFGGQEHGVEDWTDQEIIDFTFENFAAAREFGSVADAGIAKIELRRNRSPWETLLLCEPGVEQFRPGPRTPFRNMFFAGDWVKNRVSVVSMEGAITSGIEAADLLLETAR